MLMYNFSNDKKRKIKYKCNYCNSIFISNSEDLKVERFEFIGGITFLSCLFFVLL